MGINPSTQGVGVKQPDGYVADECAQRKELVRVAYARALTFVHIEGLIIEWTCGTHGEVK